MHIRPTKTKDGLLLQQVFFDFFKGLSIYYVIRDGGGLPDFLQYYTGVGLESLLQYYSFERKMEGYNPFSALN